MERWWVYDIWPIWNVFVENGDYYKGEFKNELPNGKGVIRSKNKKEIYNGYVKNGKKHGDGQFTENGFIYVVNFATQNGKGD